MIAEENVNGELVEVITASCSRVLETHLPDDIELEDAMKKRNILGEISPRCTGLYLLTSSSSRRPSTSFTNRTSAPNDER